MTSESTNKENKTTESDNQATGSETKVVKSRVLGLPDVREEMDRLWEAILSPTRQLPFFNRTSQPVPAMDVFEKEGQLHVRVELPGMTEKDVEVTLDDGVLTVTGEKQDKSEVKQDNYYRSERTYGSFTRQVALPANADTAGTTASFKDGVLEIALPLKAMAEKKHVEIKAAS